LAGRIEATASSHEVVDIQLGRATVALDSVRDSISESIRLFGIQDAADFAAKVEDISRVLEYLQVVAARAVERTRAQAQQTNLGHSAAVHPAVGAEWRTGWTEPVTRERTLGAANATTATSLNGAVQLDDGYRNAAEFLRARLRISIGEAKRRLALAPVILPGSSMIGQDLPPRHGILAEAAASAENPRAQPPSSAMPWTKSGSSPTTRPSPGWNML